MHNPSSDEPICKPFDRMISLLFTHWSIARNIVKSKSNSEEHLKLSYTSFASVQMENYWFLKGVSPFPHHSANPMKKRIVKRHLVGGWVGAK